VDLLAVAEFHEEYKQLGQAFTAVMAPIIETIDRYGLKKHHLAKHKAGVQAFLEMVLHQNYRSAVARSYQERFASIRTSCSVSLTMTAYLGITTMPNMR
jgi:hypothetical protein